MNAIDFGDSSASTVWKVGWLTIFEPNSEAADECSLNWLLKIKPLSLLIFADSFKVINVNWAPTEKVLEGIHPFERSPRY